MCCHHQTTRCHMACLFEQMNIAPIVSVGAARAARAAAAAAAAAARAAAATRRRRWLMAGWGLGGKPREARRLYALTLSARI